MRKVIGGLVSMFLLVSLYCCLDAGETKPGETPLRYVGSQACQPCHQKEYADYLSSDHFHAMDSAHEGSVRADFDSSVFIHLGDTTVFLRRNGQYIVRTPDSTGRTREFTVRYSFGWDPLQQYLVAFEDGRVQALPFCWDTRPREEGGQRWFHIYGREHIPPGDDLFWMGINQNWNYMCADCHTTGFNKNFDLASNRFHSTWAEQTVSCESCHGRGSRHITWAENGAKPEEDPLKGFSVYLGTRHLEWVDEPGRNTRVAHGASPHDSQVQTCARCHARATRFSDDYVHGQDFLQTHLPSTLDSSVYHIDGQIKEEDYEYGSFLQSKMYAAGVTCSHCHDPHSARLRLPGNDMCGSCHNPSVFNTPDHTKHKTGSTGSSCANCHMPTATFMGIDVRRDHSFRIPRPDLSLELGTPNACNQCHADRPVAWAAKHFRHWYGDSLRKTETFGELFHHMARQDEKGEPSMFRLLTERYPAIVKATALNQYGQYASRRVAGEVQKLLRSSDALVRLNAIRALQAYPREMALAAAPLLADSVRMVRLEAVSMLAPHQEALDPASQQRFAAALNEYLEVQKSMSHRPEGFLNQGIILSSVGRMQEAEFAYLSGLQRFPGFLAFYTNLADLYRGMQNEAKAREYIDRGLQMQPDNGFLHYSLGLWYVRQKQTEKGIESLKKATALAPDDPSFLYGYAIGLYSTGKQQEAIHLLEKNLSRHRNHPSLLEGLASLYADMGQQQKAAEYQQLRARIFGY